jgi:hypothetical protein
MTRPPRAPAPAHTGEPPLAPLASVTLARLYLGQRQPDRARAMLAAVLARNPADVAARALARRVGPAPSHLTLAIVDGQLVARGWLAASPRPGGALELVVVLFRGLHPGDGRSHVAGRGADDLPPEERFTRAIRVRTPTSTDLTSTPRIAASPSFEATLDGVPLVGPASIVACLRVVAPARASAASSEHASARIIAVAPPLHL